MATIFPHLSRILVRKLGSDKTDGGLLLPNNYQKDGCYLAEVVRLGRAQISKDGKIIPFNVKPGDKILVGAALGYDFRGQLEDRYGKGLTLIFEADIFAVVDSPYDEWISMSKSDLADLVAKARACPDMPVDDLFTEGVEAQ